MPLDPAYLVPVKPTPRQADQAVADDLRALYLARTAPGYPFLTGRGSASTLGRLVPATPENVDAMWHEAVRKAKAEELNTLVTGLLREGVQYDRERGRG